MARAACLPSLPQHSPRPSPPTPLGSAEAAACVINGTPVTTIAAQAECDALVALYTSTDGPNWDTNTGWTTPDRPVHLARRHL